MYKRQIDDLSAVVTGLLLALNLPATLPWWEAVIGGVFAIVVVKCLFGGLGQNFMNPALGARCFLLIAFAADMTKFGITKNGIEVYSSVTPLAAMRNGEAVNTMDMLIGRTAGTIGETSAIAILIGAIFLILMGVINLRICLLYTSDLNSYKEKQMRRRINTLITKNHIATYDEYVALIKKDKEKFEQFINFLTINVSEFYRNPDQWKILDVYKRQG